MTTLLTSWPDWTRLYWLIAAPLAALLLWALYRTRQHSKDWRAILPVAFHAILLKQHTPRQRALGYLTLAFAWLCALLALLGPSWEMIQEESTHKNRPLPLVIAIQLTPDVLAKDLAPSRLQLIREKIMTLLDMRADASTALVVYAGSAHTLVPLSNDLLTSTNLLEALHPNLMPLTGQRADLAIQRALELLQQGAQSQGQILLISNGVSVNEQIAIQQLLKNKPAQLLLLGVGSKAGAPIILSTEGDLLTDASGAIVISKLNATSLQLLARQTASPYAALESNQDDLEYLGLLNQSGDTQHSQQSTSPATQKDQGYWFILPLLLLAASFARRGSILIILLGVLPMLPTPVYAFEFRDLWLRPDQQGQKLLEQDQPALAAERFHDPAWRASAWYQAEDYQRAADAYAELDTAEAHYNRGNALALNGDLAESLAAYQQALERAPEMLAAQYNYDVVAEYLQRNNAPKEENTTEPAVESEVLASSATQTQESTSNQTAIDADTTFNPSNKAKPLDDTLITPTLDLKQANNTRSDATPALQNPAVENQQSIDLEAWLEQIPDDPSELLKRKFWYEQQRQETQP